MKPEVMSNVTELLEHLVDVNEGLGFSLSILSRVQGITSQLVPGAIPDEGEAPSMDAIRTYFLALMVELGELLQELNWKPWKLEREIDKDKVAGEFADILAFLGILLVYCDRLGISQEQIAAAYTAKTKTNVQRFLGKEVGYGVKRITD